MSTFRTLLLAHHGGDKHVIQLAVKQFSESVAQRTDGQIAIATVPNSALGNLPELLRLVVDGAADMVLSPYDRLCFFAPIFGCIGMPFVFDDYAHADRVLDGELKAWAINHLDASGIVYLENWEWGFRQITNSCRPILVPEDIRGLKIRVPPVPPYRATILAFGGIPVMVEFPRLASVIRQGLIDGQENPLSVICSLGLQHEQKYLSLLNYSYSSLGHVINSRSFASLAPEQQVILREESAKAGQFMRRLVRAQEAEQLAAFASQGMLIDRPDPAPFKALMQPVYQGLCADYGAETVHRFLSMVELQRQAPELLAT